MWLCSSKLWLRYRSRSRRSWVRRINTSACWDLDESAKPATTPMEDQVNHKMPLDHSGEVNCEILKYFYICRFQFYIITVLLLRFCGRTLGSVPSGEVTWTEMYSKGRKRSTSPSTFNPKYHNQQQPLEKPPNYPFDRLNLLLFNDGGPRAKWLWLATLYFVSMHFQPMKMEQCASSWPR